MEWHSLPLNAEFIHCISTGAPSLDYASTWARYRRYWGRMETCGMNVVVKPFGTDIRFYIAIWFNRGRCDAKKPARPVDSDSFHLM